MRKTAISVIILFFGHTIYAQNQKTKPADEVLKDSIYIKNKNEVMNYSMNEFQHLFFEFSEKKFDKNIVLTKVEFYTYTVKIATYSERLAALYPKEKEVAAENKKKWLSERYEDYLLSKQSQKK